MLNTVESSESLISVSSITEFDLKDLDYITELLEKCRYGKVSLFKSYKKCKIIEGDEFFSLLNFRAKDSKGVIIVKLMDKEPKICKFSFFHNVFKVKDDVIGAGVINASILPKNLAVKRKIPIYSSKYLKFNNFIQKGKLKKCVGNVTCILKAIDCGI